MNPSNKPVDRWALQTSGNSIRWMVAQDSRLPHEDHIEMSGLRISLVAYFKVASDTTISETRRIIWPTLRANPKDVRGYLKISVDDQYLPRITRNGRRG